MSCLFYDETTFARLLNEFGKTISAEMEENLVIEVEVSGICGNFDVRQSTMLENPMDFGEGNRIVIDMLEHI